MNRVTVFISSVIVTLSVNCQATIWELPGIFGNAPGVWKEGRNWTWSAGNPMTDKGAKWTVSYQPSKSDTMTMKPMVQGTAWKFNFVWRDAGDGSDPEAMYFGTCISGNAVSAKECPAVGPKSAVIFTPQASGKFKIEIESSKVLVQAPSAGHARFTIAVVDAGVKTLKEIKSFEINVKGGYGDLPDSVTFADDIQLKEGESIAVFIQSVNPGPASCGKSSIEFKKFKVLSEE